MIALITGITVNIVHMGKTTAQKGAHVVKDGKRHKDVYATAVGDTTKAFLMAQNGSGLLCPERIMKTPGGPVWIVADLRRIFFRTARQRKADHRDGKAGKCRISKSACADGVRWRCSGTESLV